MKRLLAALLAFALPAASALAQTLTLRNDAVTFTVVVDSGKLVSEELAGGGSSLRSDGGFGLEIMWTDWQAPAFANNAENPVRLAARDFRIERHALAEEQGTRTLRLEFAGVDMPLLLRMTYELPPHAPFVRRTLAVEDTSDAGHFLQKIEPLDLRVAPAGTIVKKGGFGQPVAFMGSGSGGAFAGIEYPAADNLVEEKNGALRVTCGHEMGVRIGSSWVAGEPAVLGLTPDADIKRHFMAYLDGVRVAPLRPYTLYNSWYDLRSPEYPRVAPGNVMNEENVLRIIGLIRKNMIESHGIKLDAFVLDDGWDVYESDWLLRGKQFPRGLSPVAAELGKTGTTLGLWLGPTGGYSFRMRRINWMKEHGYETVGRTKNTAMLCLGGTKYGSLFRERLTTFAGKEGVGYFKWDGIQFSCSEPDHGHPVGIYSRRAVMESLIDKCAAARAANPAMFLNITSGTWLSPWWVKYANTIWMQGADYGYADVPSLSPRDAAITYRDMVLFDDFINHDWWFPIANLMTHGIIKGNLERLGGADEPLDKFTNEVVCYAARGVAMRELYISPDILTPGEWDALSGALAWANDRFGVLSSTEMTGGDPALGRPYAYVHFKEAHGIISARNPVAAPGSVTVALTTAFGLPAKAGRLVVEEVYPRRFILPQLYSPGDTLVLPLGGYEAAVYELYPLADAKEPLVAGVPFDVVRREGRTMTLAIRGAGGTLLNPALVEGNPDLSFTPAAASAALPKEANTDAGGTIAVDAPGEDAFLAILLTPEKGMKKLPALPLSLDGRSDTARAPDEGAVSTWYTLKVPPGHHEVALDPGNGWRGHAAVWMHWRERPQGKEVTLTARASMPPRPMPPLPFPPGVIPRSALCAAGPVPRGH